MREGGKKKKQNKTIPWLFYLGTGAGFHWQLYVSPPVACL